MDLLIVKERLTSAGLKATQQRMVVLHALTHMHNHPTAEQVYEAVKPENPSISLATVYKTLEAFVANNLLHKVSSPEGNMRYDPKLEHHGHIHCMNTKEIIDYHDEELNMLIMDFFKKKKVNNLTIKNINLQINGEKINPDKSVSIK